MQTTYPSNDYDPECIKKLSNLNSKKPNNTIRKWIKDTDRHFSKEDMQTSEKHTEDTCSVIRAWEGAS